MIQIFSAKSLKSQLRLIVTLSLLMLGSMTSFQAHSVTKIPVWTYHLTAPYITGREQGLSYEFIELLNEFTKGKHEFMLEPLPRTRVNRNLDDHVPGMVLFVNWVWMKDKNKTKYLWSESILNDANVLVSRLSGKAPSKIDYANPQSLHGYVFGGLPGRRYNVLEQSFSNKDIIRLDVRSEEQNIHLLLNGRIDITSSSDSIIRYIAKANGSENDLYFSPYPLYSYTRHFLMTKDLKPIQQIIDEFIVSLKDNDKWLGIKLKYSVK